MFVFLLQVKAQEKVMDCHLKNISFPEFSEAILNQTGVRIYYRSEWISKLKITLDADSITAGEALTRVLKGTGLLMSYRDGDLVVLPGVKLLAGLPSYAQVATAEVMSGKKEEAITETEARYITGRRPGVTQRVTIGAIAFCRRLCD